MGRKGFGGELTNLDRQFVSFIKEYQNRIKNDQDFKEKKYDEDEIISFAKSIDVSLRRKQERNLRVACNAAISYCKTEEQQDSDEYEVNPNDHSLMDTPQTNQMNNQLLSMYKTQPAIPVAEKEDLTLKQKRKNTKIDRLEAKKSKIISDEKWPTPTVNLSALGGIEDVAQELLQLIGMPLQHPEIFRHLGIDPPRGVLLHGPPGKLYPNPRLWKDNVG
jgi:ribosome biogenesis ATPase